MPRPHVRLARCAATKGRGQPAVPAQPSGGKGGKEDKQQPSGKGQRQQQADDTDDEAEEEVEDVGEDGFLGEYDEGEFEDEGEGGDEFASAFLEPDDAEREVSTGGTAWGDVVLRAAQEVLAQPNMQNLELYLFRAIVASKKVDIRLDKLDDMYGSPSIDDIERFSRAMYAILDRELGVEAAGDISFEVSSPGAERIVRVPEELQRFGELPLKVEYRTAEGQDTSLVLVLAELDVEAGTSTWRLANVRANATTKGRALSKRQLSQRIDVPLCNITRVRIHVDF